MSNSALAELFAFISGICIGAASVNPVKRFIFRLKESRRACWYRPHEWSGWTENFSAGAIGERYRQCGRCFKMEVGE
jgi:hypothetical protein